MKVIRYQVLGKITVAVLREDDTYENVEQDILCEVERPYSIQNEELVKTEAYNGEYNIEDDGQAETVFNKI